MLELREPGSTPVGETLRTLLKDGTIRLAPLTEAFLFEAARHELVVRRIRPALTEGQWVVVDRFYDSTTAYRGWGRGLDVEMLCRMHRDACGETVPDLTLLLDIDTAVGLSRARSVTRGQGETARDRFEQEGIAFLERVREGFLSIARAEPNRIVVIPVTGDAEMVVECCLRAVEEKFSS